MAKRPRAALGAPDRSPDPSSGGAALLLRRLTELPALLSPPSSAGLPPGDRDAAVAGVESWLSSARREVGTASAAD